MFRRPKGDPEAERQILFWIEAGNAVRPEFGTLLFQFASAEARELSERFPTVPRYRRALGSALYGLAAAKTAEGNASEAVAVLLEAENAYLSLSKREFPVDRWVADVRARRALAYATLGLRVSAVAEMQSAYLGYGMDVGDATGLDYVRILSVASDVLAVCGDPDLAVSCAETALRMVRERTGPLDTEQTGYLCRAAWVAATVHTARGRTELARSARSIAEAIIVLDGRPLPDPTLLTRQLTLPGAPDLENTLAAALDAFEARLGQEIGASLRDRLTQPPADEPLFLPIDRSFNHIDRSLNHEDPYLGIASATSLATILLKMAGELMELDPSHALRLGLEAHWLYSGTFWLVAAGSPLPTADMELYYSYPFRPRWARMLLQGGSAALAAGDLNLAMDIADQASAILKATPPATEPWPGLDQLLAQCAELESEVTLAVQRAGNHRS